jgi:molybdate transport system substrate-binding protein
MTMGGQNLSHRFKVPPMTTITLSGISSMATRQVLADLVAAYQQRSGAQVAIESVGGVDAAKRVQAGEAFDVVVLASDAMARLQAGGHVLAPLVPLVHSAVAVAVRAGAALPDLGSEAAVKQAVLASPSIAYSTGPSGVALAQLFERWGIAEQVASRLVTPPPGVPVGSLVAKGEVVLGFQQRSELINLEGITVVGDLPAEIAINTTFTAGVCAACTQPEAARGLLAYLASPEAAQAKQRQGMQPA